MSELNTAATGQAPAAAPPPPLGPAFWTGVTLVATCWPLNWSLPGLRTHLLFFPLWLGYTLVVDGIVRRRRGSSILSRSPRVFAALYAASVPIWWLFELFNRRLDNWVYSARDRFSDVEYFVLASICFSTVIPAVFASAELVRSSRWVERLASGPRAPNSSAALVGYLTFGTLLLALLLLWPRYFFPLLWIHLLFLSDPIAYRLDRPSMLRFLVRGDWRPALSLALGALLCGFFWELWNFGSEPRWTYRVPFVDFWRVFEMPLLGYGGYLPFGLELYALAHLIVPVSGRTLVRLGERRASVESPMKPVRSDGVVVTSRS